MTRYLQVAEGHRLPIEMVGDSTCVFGRKRSGKSNTAVVVVEETMDLGGQAVIFDPKGDWWGITSSFDGKKPGYNVVVIGGKHGNPELPLNINAGAAIADWIIDTSLSVVVDLSGLEPNEVERLMAPLLKQIRKRQDENPRPILLVFDEADELAPEDQRARAPILKTMGLIIWFVKRGGFAGCGTLVITQRPASLSKNITSQTEVLVIMQTTGSQDLDALADALRHHVAGETKQARQAALEELLREIVKLEKGSAIVVSGQLLKAILRIPFRRRRTWDSGATPEFGQVQRAPKVVSKVAIAQLSDAMKKAVVAAQANNPETLRRMYDDLVRTNAIFSRERSENQQRIASLEAEVAELSKRKPATEQVKLGKADVMALRRFLNVMERIAHRLEVAGPHLAAAASDLREAVPGIGRQAGPLVDALAKLTAVPPVAAPKSATGAKALGSSGGPTPLRPLHPASHMAPRPPVSPHGEQNGDEPPVETHGDLTPGAQRALDVICMLERRGIPITRFAIASWIPSRKPRGLHPKGGSFGVDLGLLRSRGLVEADSWEPTAAGRELANPMDRGVTGVAAVLRPTQYETLTVLMDAGRPLTRAEIAQVRGVHPKGGSFGWDLSRLQRMGVMTKTTPYEAVSAAIES